MAKPLRPKRGTTAKNDAFTGLASEITIDTEKHSIRVHDGVTAGGVAEILPKAKNDELYAPKDLDVGVTSVNDETGAIKVKKLIMGGHVLELKEDGTLKLDANEVITSAGGMFTGGIAFPCGGGIEVHKDFSDELTLRANSEQENPVGAFLALRTKDSKTGEAGSFKLGARETSDENAVTLDGYVNGVLLWNGKDVERVNSKNNTNALSYVRFESGIQIVWGHSQHDAFVTFPVPFANNAYTAVGTLNRLQGQDPTGAANAVMGTFIEKSVTGFKVLAINAMNDSWANDGSYISWMVVGWWK